jgi:hypothetical protein
LEKAIAYFSINTNVACYTGVMFISVKAPSIRYLTIMRNSFPISELDFRDGSQKDQVRTRKIFEALRAEARENKILTEHEKDFFYQGLMLSHFNDGRPEDFICCDNPKFKSLYLSYYHDLSGASPVFKLGNLRLRIVGNQEKFDDLKYLYRKQDEWKKTVNKQNHKEALLQEASKEARLELKKFYDSLNGKNRNFKSNPNFTNNEIEREILLKSKYIYCIALKMFETIDEKDLVLEINSHSIEVNEYSMIHILNRHFAAQTIYYDTSKSFHTEDFEPKLLNLQLRKILMEIDVSTLYKNFPIDKIVFQFKGIDYQIWTGLQKKHIEGKAYEFRRLNSFYSINDVEEKKKLLTNYKIVDINKDIKLYLPR